MFHNLLLLCGFHHGRHHEGAYRIRKTAGGYSFETDDGHVIQPPARDPITLDRNLLHAQNPDIGPHTPVAQWGGEEMDFSMR
jgi:hypothetical protein